MSILIKYNHPKKVYYIADLTHGQALIYNEALCIFNKKLEHPIINVLSGARYASTHGGAITRKDISVTWDSINLRLNDGKIIKSNISDFISEFVMVKSSVVYVVEQHGLNVTVWCPTHQEFDVYATNTFVTPVDVTLSI